MFRFLFMVLFVCLTACSRMAYEAQLAAMERLENDFRTFDLNEERRKENERRRKEDAAILALQTLSEDESVLEASSPSEATMERSAHIVSESPRTLQGVPFPRQQAEKELVTDMPLTTSLASSAPEIQPASPPACEQILNEVDSWQLEQCAGRVVQLREVQCIDQAYETCMNPPNKKAIDDLSEWRCKSKKNERIKKVTGQTEAVTL